MRQDRGEEPTEPQLVRRTNSWLGGSVSELIDVAAALGPELTEIRVTGGHLKYESLETPEEVEHRLAWRLKLDQRTEEWERETLARLQEKYGGESV